MLLIIFLLLSGSAVALNTSYIIETPDCDTRFQIKRDIEIIKGKVKLLVSSANLRKKVSASFSKELLEGKPKAVDRIYLVHVAMSLGREIIFKINPSPNPEITSYPNLHPKIMGFYDKEGFIQSLYNIFASNRALLEFETRGEIVSALQMVWPNGRFFFYKNVHAATEFRKSRHLLTWQVIDERVLLFADQKGLIVCYEFSKEHPASSLKESLYSFAPLPIILKVAIQRLCRAQYFDFFSFYKYVLSSFKPHGLLAYEASLSNDSESIYIDLLNKQLVFFMRELKITKSRSSKKSIQQKLKSLYRQIDPLFEHSR